MRRGMCTRISRVPFCDYLGSSFYLIYALSALFRSLLLYQYFSWFILLLLIPIACVLLPLVLLFFPSAHFILYYVLPYVSSAFRLTCSILSPSCIHFSLPSCICFFCVTVLMLFIFVFTYTSLFFVCTSPSCSFFVIASYFLCLSSSCLPFSFLYLLRPHTICDRVFFRVIYCCRAQVCWSRSVVTL